jgi:hypothetical protein
MRVLTHAARLSLGMLRLYDYFYHKEHLFIVTELLRVRSSCRGDIL